MPNYDFLTLSPVEFENLSRDILQEHLNLTLESFANAKDSGIDFRYAKGNLLIVQSKRYTNFAPLFASLRKEVKKVEILNPHSYILTTSVSLTPNQKNKILELFAGFIKSANDIYGKDDLNNLLNSLPHIEKRHFKLWLSSISILEKILHSKIFNQASFEKDEIIETLKVYVENESYYKALEVLNEKNFVVITGIPGVGKTTLSRVLVYHFLSKGYKEFYSLSKSISEAYDIFQEGVKQIFLFDDFLGRDFLNQRIPTNEESRIIRFIERVNRSKDKIIIFNTREYIFAQAIERYERFNNALFKKGKYAVNLDEYTHSIRAKILYNHIVFSKAPPKFIDSILGNDNYERILSHDNFNPRTIQLIFEKSFLKTIDPEKLTETLLAYFDNPFQIWDYVYKNDISKLSQLLLAGLATIGDSIFLDDLKLLLQGFCARNIVKYNVSCSELEFNKSLLELEGTFLQYTPNKRNQVIVDFKNPSVVDFLIYYLEYSPDLIDDLIKSATFFNQLITIFISSGETKMSGRLRHKIVLTEKQMECWEQKMKSDFSTLNFSMIKYSIASLDLVREEYTDYYKLYTIIEWCHLRQDGQMRKFVIDEFKQRLFPDKWGEVDFKYYVELLILFYGEFDSDWFELLDFLFHQVRNLEDILEFEKLRLIFKGEYEEFAEQTEDYKETIQYVMRMSAQHCEEFDLEDTLENVKLVSKKTGVDGRKAKNILKKRLKERVLDEDLEFEDDDIEDENRKNISDSEEDTSGMFDSLRTLESPDPDDE